MHVSCEAGEGPQNGVQKLVWMVRAASSGDELHVCSAKLAEAVAVCCLCSAGMFLVVGHSTRRLAPELAGCLDDSMYAYLL